MPSGDAAHVAQHRRNAVRDTVGGDVLAAVGVCPVVDIDRIDVLRAAFGGDDRQHARAAAHVESPAARDAQIEHGARNEPRSGVVSGPERHLGHDDHLHDPFGGGIVERRTDQQAAFDIDGREIALPYGVPVLGLDGDIASLHAVAGQQGIDPGFAVGQPLLRNVGFERPVFGFEALEGIVGQLGGEYFGLLILRKGNIQRYIVHIM